MLLTAFAGGSGTGALVGIVLGFFASLSASSPEYSKLCGVLGIITSLCSGNGTVFSCIAAIMFTVFLAVCIKPADMVVRFWELLISGGIFLLCADVFSKYAGRFFVKASSNRDMHIRNYAAEKLNLASKAFSALGQVVTEVGKSEYTPGNTSAGEVLKRTSDEVCKGCTLSEICWQRDFNTTKDAMNNASLAIEKNGILSAKDFPIHFSSRCLKMEKFVNSANREIFSAKYRRRLEKKLSESHQLITRQYKEAAEIFYSVSSDISNNARFEEDAETSVSHLLSSYGILCDTAVYRDSNGHINIHLYPVPLASFLYTIL